MAAGISGPGQTYLVYRPERNIGSKLLLIDLDGENPNKAQAQCL